MPIELWYLTGFLLLLVLQAWVINGVHDSFSGKWKLDDGKIVKEGMIFYPLAYWLDNRIKNEWIKKPLWKCVKCMASVWGALTFWPVVLFVFGFHFFELYIFVCDVFALVYLNYFFYKRA